MRDSLPSFLVVILVSETLLRKDTMTLNPITQHKQFNGTLGTLCITIGLPVLIASLGLILTGDYVFQGNHISSESISKVLDQGLIKLVFDKQCWIVYLSWFFGVIFVDLLTPGTILQGVKLRDGSHLDYKINGVNFMAILLTVLLGRLIYLNGYLPELAFLYDHMLQLSLITIVFTFVMSTFLYLYSFVPLQRPNGVGTHEKILAEHGNTGNWIYDWFIGRELNPRIGPVDLKYVCELKPGLPLWLLINLSCCHHQYHQTGKVYDSLIVVTFLQALYIFDGVLNESGILTMMDIVTDGFGFMLCFGDLSLVPWTYSIQARYLSQNYVELGIIPSILVVALSLIGFYIFRASNQQKSDFKAGKLNHLKSIQTPTGSKLLIEGWWGLSQHINYLGDWFIGLSWCLSTGFNTPITYFYAAYFGALLIHRQIRDEEKCQAKYGKTWDEYTTKVPYKIIPYVY